MFFLTRDFIIKTKLISFGAVLLFLLIWKGAALLIQAEIILPPPEKVLLDFLGLLPSRKFWPALGATLIRGAAGFFLSFAAGIAAGILGGIKPVFGRLLSPFVTVIRSTPVMSVIIIALMWFSTDFVPVFVVFLTSFPITYGSISNGVREIDPKLMEMASVYRLSRSVKMKSVVFPSVIPYIMTALENTLGLTWKVVIAAEVLVVPLHAIGTGLYNAKGEVETVRVFSWTVTAILLGGVSQLLIKYLNRRFSWRSL